MGQTVKQVESEIHNAREQLGSNLEELARRIDKVTDWREHYRARPFVFMGAALAGGLALAAALRNPSGHSGNQTRADVRPERSSRWATQKDQALGVWDDVTTALVGLAAARFKGYVTELVPGLDEHLRGAEPRSATASRPAGEYGS
jgi:hypothetical protein